ncbi:hypothetical protein Tco_0104217 [Tanacetum coccineum]
MANTPVSENCSAIILKKLPEKLEDPGQFLIPCTFSELKCKALADLEKDEDPNAIFTSSKVVKYDFLTTNGDPITPPSTIPTKEDLINEKVEKHEEVEGEKNLDVKTIVSFFAPLEIVLEMGNK